MGGINDSRCVCLRGDYDEPLQAFNTFVRISGSTKTNAGFNLGFSNGSLGSILWAQEGICLEWLSRKLWDSKCSKSAIGPPFQSVVTLLDTFLGVVGFYSSTKRIQTLPLTMFTLQSASIIFRRLCLLMFMPIAFSSAANVFGSVA